MIKYGASVNKTLCSEGVILNSLKKQWSQM